MKLTGWTIAAFASWRDCQLSWPNDGCDVVDIKIEMQIQGLQLLLEMWVWCLVLHEATLALYRH
jgi:hypothetical protein